MTTVQSDHRQTRTVVPTNVCLNRALIDALDKAALRVGGCTRSAVIRHACIEFLERRGLLAGPSGEPQSRPEDGRR